MVSPLLNAQMRKRVLSHGPQLDPQGSPTNDSSESVTSGCCNALNTAAEQSSLEEGYLRASPGGARQTKSWDHFPRLMTTPRRRPWWLPIIFLLLFLYCIYFVLSGLVNATTSITTDASRSDWVTFSVDYCRRFGRTPPSELQQWLAYARRHKCETTEYYNSIDQLLQVFRSYANTTTHKSLDQIIDQATTSTELFVVFHLKNNKLSVENMQDIDSTPGFSGRPWWLAKLERYYREWSLRWLLQPVVHHKPPLSTKFVWNLMDEPAMNPTAPIFSACNVREDWDDTEIRDGNNMLAAERPRLAQNSQLHKYTPKRNSNMTGAASAKVRDLLIPYHFSIGSIGTRGGDGSFLWALLNARRFSNQPWRNRDNAISWRGSTTGAWETGPRFRLVNTDSDGINYPQLWNRINASSVTPDFAFVRVVQEQDRKLSPKYRTAGHLSYKDMQKNKYVMDVDGNSFSERFPKLLNSGTLVFKSTKYQEWFSERVKPWVHYIPVKYDLSDLPDQVSWANVHPDLAEGMVNNARRAVKLHLRPQDQRCYVYRLMLEYQTLFHE